jgi:signal transduction histidine kinase
VTPAWLPTLGPRRQLVIDAALTVVVAVPAAVALFARVESRHEPLLLLAGAAGLAATALRRRWPLWALVVTSALVTTAPDVQPLLLPALLVLYTIASTQTRMITLAAVVLVAGTAIGAGAAWAIGNLLAHAVSVSAESVAAATFGLYVGARRRVIDGLRDHADQLERERGLLAERVAVAERVRIAQELHDVIAHNVTLMVVQAQALAVNTTDQDVRTQTETIADLGRQAMTEMHRTLKLLRSDAPETPGRAPQPGLDSLEGLIRQSRAAGLDVELVVEGAPRPVAAAIDVSAYRIVQEALTNVIKHAAGAHVRVTVAYRDDEITLTTCDSGSAADTSIPESDEPGHGLIGMRERAALFGGTLTAHARSNGGFEVAAVLPYTVRGARR